MRTMNNVWFQTISATEALEVGCTYFLSSLYDQQGASVKVLSKSTKVNSAGWPSTVEVEVIAPVGFISGSYQEKTYTPGTKHICNATNLYKNREDASHTRKYGRRVV